MNARINKIVKEECPQQITHLKMGQNLDLLSTDLIINYLPVK